MKDGPFPWAIFIFIVAILLSAAILGPNYHEPLLGEDVDNRLLQD